MIDAEFYCPMVLTRKHKFNWSVRIKKGHSTHNYTGNEINAYNEANSLIYIWKYSKRFYSDGENKFEVYREFTQVEGMPFIRAVIKCRIEYLGEMNFDINEQYAFGDSRKLLSMNFKWLHYWRIFFTFWTFRYRCVFIRLTLRLVSTIVYYHVILKSINSIC